MLIVSWPISITCCYKTNHSKSQWLKPTVAQAAESVGYFCWVIWAGLRHTELCFDSELGIRKINSKKENFWQFWLPMYPHCLEVPLSSCMFNKQLQGNKEIARGANLIEMQYHIIVCSLGCWSIVAFARWRFLI